MTNICTRCARLASRSDHGVGRVLLQPSSRTFSTTITAFEDDAPKQPKKVSQNINRAGQSMKEAMGNTQTSRPGGLVIRRELVDGPSSRPSRAQTSAGGLGIRRTDSAQGGSLPRRAEYGPPQGQLLRRTGGSSQPGQMIRRTGGPRAPGTAGATGQGGQTQQQGLQRRRRRVADRPRASEDEAEFPNEAELDEYMTKHIDRPANPTEQITYNPAPQSADELHKDWPNTPLSSTGLTASVIQKIEWLARRIPHGYQTPEQLAAHFHKGNLTRFESEEEKTLVIKIAQDLAKARAEKMTEKKGEQIEPKSMTMVDLSTPTKDKKGLVDSMVKGDYTELEKQRMPFLDTIARTLRNNGTYNSTETRKFMAKVQSMMPAQGARRPAQTPKTA